MRYLIAIPLPQALADELRRRFQKIYHEPLRVKFIHSTMIPPFTIKDAETLVHVTSYLNELPEWQTQFQFGKPGMFRHSRNIFYVPLIEENQTSELHDVYTRLVKKLRPLITIEATDFKKNELPRFLAHVTLSYNFSGDMNALLLPTDSFSLPKPQLLQESGPGLWVPTP